MKTDIKIRSNMDILLRTIELANELDEALAYQKCWEDKLDEAIENMRAYLESCVGDHFLLGSLDQQVSKLRDIDQHLDGAKRRVTLAEQKLSTLRWVIESE